LPASACNLSACLKSFADFLISAFVGAARSACEAFAGAADSVFEAFAGASGNCALAGSNPIAKIIPAKKNRHPVCTSSSGTVTKIVLKF
jgi:hypothetical protein